MVFIHEEDQFSESAEGQVWYEGLALFRIMDSFRLLFIKKTHQAKSYLQLTSAKGKIFRLWMAQDDNHRFSFIPLLFHNEKRIFVHVDFFNLTLSTNHMIQDTMCTLLKIINR
jgi:hypothetical protein